MNFSLISKLDTSKIVIVPLFKNKKFKNLKINFPKQIKKDFTGKELAYKENYEIMRKEKLDEISKLYPWGDF